MTKWACALLSYNHPGITEKCIASLLRHTNSSLFLSHSGTEPKNVTYLQQKCPQLEHLVESEKRGFSGGANSLLERAFQEAPWVLFLTNDTELLEPVPAKLFENLGPGLYAPLLYRRSSGRVDSCGGVLNLRTWSLRHLNDPKEKHICPKNEAFYVPGTAFLLDRSTWQRLGGFRETYHTYWEDVEFSLRAQRAGVRLAPLSEIRLRHGIGKTCHQNPLYTLYFYQGNRTRLLRQEFAFTPRTWIVLCHFLGEMFHQTFRLWRSNRNEDLKLLWRGLWDGWRGQDFQKSFKEKRH
ncbi:MAG: hypothetical protein WCH11_03960 [Bdellovibrio sp.]